MEWKPDAKVLNEMERRRAEYVRQALAMAKLAKSSGGDPDIAKLHSETEKLEEIGHHIEEAETKIEVAEDNLKEAEGHLDEATEIAGNYVEQSPTPASEALDKPTPVAVAENLTESILETVEPPVTANVETDEIVDADDMLKAMSGGETTAKGLDSYVESHNRSAENFCPKCGKPK